MEVWADIIAALHAAIAMFIVLGLGAISMGTIFRWRWTENAAFRFTHLALVAIIAVRFAFHAQCPLSHWEDQLRGHHQRGVAATLAFRGVNDRQFAAGCAVVTLATILLGIHSAIAHRRDRQ